MGDLVHRHDINASWNWYAVLEKLSCLMSLIIWVWVHLIYDNAASFCTCPSLGVFYWNHPCNPINQPLQRFLLHLSYNHTIDKAIQGEYEGWWLNIMNNNWILCMILCFFFFWQNPEMSCFNSMSWYHLLNLSFWVYCIRCFERTV